MFLEFVAKFFWLKLLKMQLKISQCLMLISARNMNLAWETFLGLAVMQLHYLRIWWFAFMSNLNQFQLFRGQEWL